MRRGLGAIGLLLGLMLSAMPARAQCVGTTCTVATAADLVSALTTIDATPGIYTINITADRPISAPPIVDATGVKDVTVIRCNSFAVLAQRQAA